MQRSLFVDLCFILFVIFFSTTPTNGARYIVVLVRTTYSSLCLFVSLSLSLPNMNRTSINIDDYPLTNTEKQTTKVEIWTQSIMGQEKKKDKKFRSVGRK